MDKASQEGIIFIEGSGPTYATVNVSATVKIFLSLLVYLVIFVDTHALSRKVYNEIIQHFYLVHYEQEISSLMMVLVMQTFQDSLVAAGAGLAIVDSVVRPIVSFSVLYISYFTFTRASILELYYFID